MVFSRANPRQSRPTCTCYHYAQDLWCFHIYAVAYAKNLFLPNGWKQVKHFVQGGRGGPGGRRGAIVEQNSISLPLLIQQEPGCTFASIQMMKITFSTLNAIVISMTIEDLQTLTETDQDFLL